MKSKAITVVQDEQEPVPTEVLAQAIVKISDGFQRLQRGGLNRHALSVLLKASTGVTMQDIERVLNGLECLKDEYCTKPAKSARR